MTWSARKRCDGYSVWLDLEGDLSGPAARPLQQLIVLDAIAGDRPGRLLIDLEGVSSIDSAGVTALMSGYVAAVDHGVSYRVTGAQGRARRSLTTAGILDVLSDSDDMGSLLLAVLLLPPEPASTG